MGVNVGRGVGVGVSPNALGATYSRLGGSAVACGSGVAVIRGVGEGVALVSGASVALPGALVPAYMKSLSPSIWKEGTGRAVTSGSSRIFWEVVTRSCAFSA